MGSIANNNTGANKIAQKFDAWLEIDRNIFLENIRVIRKKLDPSVRICVVLKADAYGHGIEILMPAVLSENIDTIGISSNEDACVARINGYKGTIIRLPSVGLAEMESGLAYDIEEVIGRVDIARQADLMAKRNGQRLRVHLALNSAGMALNGMDLLSERGRIEAKEFLRLDGIEIVGITTHFPTECHIDCAIGLARFKEECDWLIECGGLDRQRLSLHAANSPALLAMPECHLDMVRTGRALYGSLTEPEQDLRLLMTFKSRITSISYFPEGSTVSYDRTMHLKRDSLLAYVRVGYSDGYSRSCSNKADVLIRGNRARVMGRVTMNAIVVDVTDIPDVAPNDEVVLFGCQEGDEIGKKEYEEIINDIIIAEQTIWGRVLPKVLKAE